MLNDFTPVQKVYLADAPTDMRISYFEPESFIEVSQQQLFRLILNKVHLRRAMFGKTANATFASHERKRTRIPTGRGKSAQESVRDGRRDKNGVQSAAGTPEGSDSEKGERV